MENDILDIIDNINKIFISKLNVCKENLSDKIEKEIYDDLIETYKRAHILMQNNRLLDGFSLTRTSFELMLMLIGMRIDKKVKEEYCRANSYDRFKERKKQNKREQDYTSQVYLRNLIVDKYPDIKVNYNEIYDLLSKYAHPTMYRNILRNEEKEKISIIPLYLSIIMILMILLIRIFNEQKIIHDEVYDDMWTLFVLLQGLAWQFVEHCNYKDKIQVLKEYIYEELNEEYYKTLKDNIKYEVEVFNKDLLENDKNINDLVINITNKLEYYNILKKMTVLQEKLKKN